MTLRGTPSINRSWSLYTISHAERLRAPALVFEPRGTDSNSHFFVIAVLGWQYLAISFGTIGSTDYLLRLAFKSDSELPTSTLALLTVTQITEAAELVRGTKLAFTVTGGLASLGVFF